jgi:hypothetical protein
MFSIVCLCVLCLLWLKLQATLHLTASRSATTSSMPRSGLGRSIQRNRPRQSSRIDQAPLEAKQAHHASAIRHARSRSHPVNTHLPHADLQEHYPIEAVNDILTFERVFSKYHESGHGFYSCLFVHEAAQRHLTRSMCLLSAEMVLVRSWLWDLNG